MHSIRAYMTHLTSKTRRTLRTLGVGAWDYTSHVLRGHQPLENGVWYDPSTNTILGKVGTPALEKRGGAR